MFGSRAGRGLTRARAALTALMALSITLVPQATLLPAGAQNVIQEDPAFLTVTCTITGFGGCTNAVLTGQLPPWVLLNGDISIAGASSEVTVDGSAIDVTFTNALPDPPGAGAARRRTAFGRRQGR